MRPIRLIAMTGLSPQVVTETLWALNRREPEAAFAAVTLLTTASGAEAAARLLPRGFRALEASLGRRLPAPEIRLLRDASGAVLEDILTDRDNAAAANAILATVAEAAARPDTRIHLSIAGGRKTMGCLAAIALSLYGRAEDRLSHVLVGPEWQGREDFFFPEREEEAERVQLAEIPFVRLRGLWRAEALEGGFAAVVAAAQAALGPPELRLDAARGEVASGGRVLRLPPALFATLLLFAERARAGLPALVVAKEEDAELNAALARALERCGRAAAAVAPRLGRAELRQRLSRINARLRQAFGPEGEVLCIRAEGRRPHTAYRLALPPEAITIREDAHGR
jgi:CRISPR-associated protein (TIGR02584 family)